MSTFQRAPGTQRPGSTAPGPASGPGSAVHRPGSSSTLPKQSSVPVSIPESAPPRPSPAKPAIPPVQVPGRVGTPLRSAGTATPISAMQGGFPHPVDQEKRGKKRERDDTGSVGDGLNGVGAVNGGVNNNPNPQKPILSAKAGMAGIRPRPMKKLRMVSVAMHCLLSYSCSVANTYYLPPYPQDIQGQSRDVTVVQQPTPQGV